MGQNCPDTCDLYVPNTLTADCEERECEILKIESNCSFKAFELTLYNRWGEVTFKSNDPEKRFDSRQGKYDVYVWTLTGKFCNSEIIDRKGHIIILR